MYITCCKIYATDLRNIPSVAGPTLARVVFGAQEWLNSAEKGKVF
jgi:hypothetical protein